MQQTIYKYLSKFKTMFKNFWKNIIDPKNRKRNLIIIGILIFTNIIILTSFFSFSYYNDSSSLVLIHARAGSVAMKNSDLAILIYAEDAYNKGSYSLKSSIPAFGYVYKSYNCDNNSTIKYNDNTKKIITEAYGKDVCRVYFDSTMTSDINILIKLETAYNSKDYKSSDDIPAAGYIFDSYECVNGSDITYDSQNNLLEVVTLNKDTCNVYFKKAE